jgi:hypothetical protein
MVTNLLANPSPGTHKRPNPNPTTVMKRSILLCLLMSSTLFADMAVSVLVKEHEDRTGNFAERPYGQDDRSYGLFLDLFEGVGGWRLGASYSDEVTGVPGIDTVITPEVGLIVMDGIWETGISVLMDYVDADGETDWGDVYFQTQLGLNLPITGAVLIGLHAFYPMESASDLFDIGFSDLDYAVQLRIMF